MLREHRWFHEHLKQMGFGHTYLEHPGEHDWTYRDEHGLEAMEQHEKVLGRVAEKPD